MAYDREELSSIGERFQPEALQEWGAQLLHAARADLPRLKSRGITEQTLRDIEAAREDVKKFQSIAPREETDVSPLARMRREAIEAAIEWRGEVTRLAEAVFDSNPDALAAFRAGVKTSASVSKLQAEIGVLLNAVRLHLAALRGVGVTESVLAHGEDVLKRLQEAQRRQPEERAQTQPLTDLRHALGVLYTRARFLARIGRVEFRDDGDKLTRYSYELLRQREAPEAQKVRPSRPLVTERARG